MKINLLLVSLTLFSCGKKSNSDDPASSSPAPTPTNSQYSIASDIDPVIGLYKGDPTTKQQDKEWYFIVTADKKVYYFVKDQLSYLSFGGSKLTGMSYEFKNNHFSSGDFVGSKVTDLQAPGLDPVLKSTTETTLVAASLIKDFNAAGLSIEHWFHQDKVVSSEKLTKILQVVAANKEVVIKFIKDKKLQGLNLNDYTNTWVYSRDGELKITTNVTISPEDFIKQIKDGTLKVTEY